MRLIVPPEVVRIWGLYRDNGKEHGNYYLGFRPPYVDTRDPHIPYSTQFMGGYTVDPKP